MGGEGLGEKKKRLSFAGNACVWKRSLGVTEWERRVPDARWLVVLLERAEVEKVCTNTIRQYLHR